MIPREPIPKFPAIQHDDNDNDSQALHFVTSTAWIRLPIYLLRVPSGERPSPLARGAFSPCRTICRT